jgi:hypothetical protein
LLDKSKLNEILTVLARFSGAHDGQIGRHFPSRTNPIGRDRSSSPVLAAKGGGRLAAAGRWGAVGWKILADVDCRPWRRLAPQCPTSGLTEEKLHRSATKECSSQKKDFAVPTSVLEAIKLGLWDFEPHEEAAAEQFEATRAMPGTPDKLDVLAERVRLGQPLWHPADRQDYDDLPPGSFPN